MDPGSDVIIETENLVYSYNQSGEGEMQALNGVSLSIVRGEFVAIIGRNGSGKSTLAKHFNALFLPTSGNVHINGMNTKDPDNLWRIRQTVGMVFQNPDNQIVSTTVEEDVAFGPENLGIPAAEIRRRVDLALKWVGMSEHVRHAPHLLSGGQKQRVAIAGVLAMKPQCIVLDEPTAMLDPSGRREVLETVKRLNEEDGITVVLITHFMSEAILGERVIVMDSGKIVMDDVPGKIFNQVELLRQLDLDVPQVTQLAHELAESGVPVARDALTIKEFINSLHGLYPSVITATYGE